MPTFVQLAKRPLQVAEKLSFLACLKVSLIQHVARAVDAAEDCRVWTYRADLGHQLDIQSPVVVEQCGAAPVKISCPVKCLVLVAGENVFPSVQHASRQDVPRSLSIRAIGNRVPDFIHSRSRDIPRREIPVDRLVALVIPFPPWHVDSKEIGICLHVAIRLRLGKRLSVVVVDGGNDFVTPGTRIHRVRCLPLADQCVCLFLNPSTPIVAKPRAAFPKEQRPKAMALLFLVHIGRRIAVQEQNRPPRAVRHASWAKRAPIASFDALLPRFILVSLAFHTHSSL